MFNCKEVSRKVSESMDCVLPLQQEILVRAHLLICKYCARFRDQLLLIRKTIRAEEGLDETSKAAEPCPPGLRKRIKQMLKNQSGKKPE